MKARSPKQLASMKTPTTPAKLGKQKSLHKNLYFSAIILPPPFLDEVESLKAELSRQYQSMACLRSPAHITLFPPWAMPPAQQDKLLASWHRALSLSQTSNFTLSTTSVKHFSQHTLYLAIKTCYALTRLQKTIALSMQEFLNLAEKALSKPKQTRPFIPHITLAFKDISWLKISKALDLLQHRDLRRSMQISEIHLLRFNQLKHCWQRISTMPLVL